MSRNNDAEKLKLLVTLAASFGKTFTEEIYEMWLEALEDYEIDQLKKAIKDVVLHVKYMPSIAELTDAADRHHVPSAKEIRLMTPEESAIRRRWSDCNDAGIDDEQATADWEALKRKWRLENETV